MSLGLSILYSINLLAEPSHSRMAFKTIATALLAVFAGTQSVYWQLVPALVLGSLGDAFLAWPGDETFFRGLSSFLVAHLFYISLFAGIGNGLGFVLHDTQRLGLAGAMLLLAPFMSFTLMPKVAQSLRIPIALYSTVILAMVLSVLTVENDQVVLGAILFAISDSVLATDEFLMPKDSAYRGLMQHVVWLFYYTGQLLIVTGLVDGWDWVNQLK
ncbi:YhhN-like protein [Metarhizium album ARSEF 1941]|uniref:YhhN-like protein n=1 Tax=Metarhizium album (strain ARSEF 1941) TaxID=1081103 RepID=A0A0B2WQ22_METAS|nr:YhhN-like protein [Metarhizium album ARSEF 1941]KHN95587.1 YhhN-like protein [Metarhizium album ARSEF 1941]